MAGRLIFSEGNRSFYLGSLLVALATVAGVFAVTSVLQFPGAEYQRDPSTYLSSALNMLKDLFTPKGVYRNLLLPASLIGLWLIALCAPHRRRVVQPADLGVILGMVAICCAVDVKYNIGRISAYAAPMFVIGAAQALSWMLSERGLDHEPRQN